MDCFYLKLDDNQANSMMAVGLPVLFQGQISAFTVYTDCVIDKGSGEKFWKVKNIQKKGITYDVISYVRSNYPGLTEYTADFVNQFR